MLLIIASAKLIGNKPKMYVFGYLPIKIIPLMKFLNFYS